MARGGRLIAVGVSGLLVGLALNQAFVPQYESGILNGWVHVEPLAVLPAWFLATVGPIIIHASRRMSTWFLPSFCEAIRPQHIQYLDGTRHSGPQSSRCAARRFVCVHQFQINLSLHVNFSA